MQIRPRKVPLLQGGHLHAVERLALQQENAERVKREDQLEPDVVPRQWDILHPHRPPELELWPSHDEDDGL